MVDPIEMILSALTEGARKNLSNVADQTVTRFYRQLVDKISTMMKGTFDQKKIDEVQSIMNDPELIEQKNDDLVSVLNLLNIHKNDSIIDLARQLIGGDRIQMNARTVLNVNATGSQEVYTAGKDLIINGKHD